MDQVWRAQKFDAPLHVICMGRANIGYVEVDDRLWAAGFLRLGQEQADTPAIEKGEITEGIKVFKTSTSTVPRLGFLNVPNGTRDLEIVPSVRRPVIVGSFLKRLLSRRTPVRCRSSLRRESSSFCNMFATWYFTASVLTP